MKKYRVNEWTQIISNQSYCHDPTVWNSSEELTQNNQRILVTIMENHAIYISFTKQRIFYIR